MSTSEDVSQTVFYANRYEKIKKLGQGSYGTVYLVHDWKSKEEKKVLKSISIGDLSPNESSDAEHEARLLARLRHQHIVRFYDSFIDDQCFCIVTEFCEDGDLDQFLRNLRRQKNRLQVDQVIDLFIQLLSAIDFLHQRRILHRDIKTSNIFLKRNYLKLGDFGISRLMMHTLDKASTFIGTPFYMSPETLRYDGYNTKADIWSLGCVLYEMSVCKRAFERPNLMKTMQAILHEPPPVLPERFPEKVRQIYSQMLSKDPEQRSTASDILVELKSVETKSVNLNNVVKESSTPEIEKKTTAFDFQRAKSNDPQKSENLNDSEISFAAAASPPTPIENPVVEENQFDPFSSASKTKMMEFNRNTAKQLIGEQSFNEIYKFLKDQRHEQAKDSTLTDDQIFSGLENFNTNSYACTLINALVLYEYLNEIDQRESED